MTETHDLIDGISSGKTFLRLVYCTVISLRYSL